MIYSWVYIVKCDVGKGKIGYYVGIWSSEHCETRMRQHFNGDGSRFTIKYRPISFTKVGYFKNGIALRMENLLTAYYLKKVGFRFARGGNHLNMKKNCHELTQLMWWLPYSLRQDLLSGRLGVPDHCPLLA
jgi:predicted GIY-YIG superfamily endonuclease